MVKRQKQVLRFLTINQEFCVDDGDTQSDGDLTKPVAIYDVHMFAYGVSRVNETASSFSHLFQAIENAFSAISAAWHNKERGAF